MSSDEDACDICEGDKSSKKNPIIFCDGEDCNLPVHKLCYKVDEVPEDDWFCQRCDNKRKNKPANIICCPTEAGAARHTVTFGEFMHVVCAMWNKEINSDIEPYSFYKNRLGQKEVDCTTSFHATCAINNGLITASVAVPSYYSPKCIKHLFNYPTKKFLNRRRLRPGSSKETSDEESDVDKTDDNEENEENDEEKRPIRKGPLKKEIPIKRPSGSVPNSDNDDDDDDDDDDMGTSKKIKKGNSYRDMYEAKRKKSNFESKNTLGVDIKRPSITTPPLQQISTTIGISSSGPSTPLKPKLALGHHRPSVSSIVPPLKKMNGPDVHPQPSSNAPRWTANNTHQPMTPSITSSKPFFDIESVQRKSTETWKTNGDKDETKKLREELRKMAIEKEEMSRTLSRITEDYNRLREEKKKWINFKQTVAEVFSGLNFQSFGTPTSDTIEQYVAQIQAMIKRCGPITDEESALIEEASKNIKPKTE